MFKRTKVNVGVLAALGAMAAASMSAHAQNQQTLERVEITGSSIKRVASEGALPVQTISKSEIARSGATSVVELIEKLPAMQGGYTEGDAIGGGGGGLAEASIHNLGGDRTLVLLNGRRVIGEAGGSVDINMIPLAAIEKIEVLTDGASAIYGSDAVAGVVNFITSRNTQAGGLELRLNKPQHPGAKETGFALSKGFGSLDSDGINVLLSASYDKRNSLSASQRDFSKSGIITFGLDGKEYLFFNGSPRSIPGNVVMPNGSLGNPYKVANGVCPPSHVDVEGDCYFDYASTVMAFPTRERTNLMGNVALKVNPDTMLTFDSYYAKTSSRAAIAAVPGELSIDPNGPLGSYLSAVGWDPADGNATVSYRVMDLGGRTAVYKRESYGFWLGAEGRAMDWDYKAALGYQNTHYQEYNQGYPFGIAFNDLMNSGLWNPFVLPGNQSPAAIAAAKAALTDGYYDGEVSTLKSMNVQASREVFKLGGGYAAWAIGANYNEDSVSSQPSDVAMGVGGPNHNDSRFGDASQAIPYSASRKAIALFSELVAPVTNELELTGAVRYDKYQGLYDATTGKVGFRYQPSKSWLIRGSVGTGFRAPNLRGLYRPLQTFGVTGDPYNCTPEMAAIAASLGAICRPDNTQYDVKIGGVPTVKPEKSKQASLGIRFEPNDQLSMGADLWWVGMRDTFGSVDENEAFANAAKYSELWTTYTDPVTGNVYLAYNESTINLAKEIRSGIDFDIVGRTSTPFGPLQSQLRATYMLRSQTQLKPGDQYFSTLGDNNPSIGEVAFRWKGTWSNTLRTGNWQNTLNVNFQSGYRDFPADVYELDSTGAIVGADTVRLKVKNYFTFDWQTAYSFNKSVMLTVGVKNLADKSPPLSLRTSGAHMLGYDYRYYSALGRVFQAKLNVSF